MEPRLLQILNESNDPSAVAEAAGALAASQDSGDLRALTPYLQSSRFLELLDDDDAYFGIAEDLKLAGLFETLMRNDRPARDNLLVQLTGPGEFLAEEARIELLITALRVVRPAPEAAIAFWDRYCQPDDGYAARTIEAALTNGSLPALQLVARKLLDRRFEVDERTEWLHRGIVPRRDRLLVVQMAASVLSQADEQPLKLAMVESLFDYRPEDWYSMHSYIVPPTLDSTPAEVRDRLAELARQLLASGDLPEVQRAVVESMLTRLNELAGGAPPAR